MDHSVTFSEGTSPSSITVGFLGVTADMDEVERAGPGYLDSLRINEIERRILAIEARLPPPTDK
jgi:hypothetical protein